MTTPAAAATWRWAFDADVSGIVGDAAEVPVHASRHDAEAWLGERWRALASAGAREARLRADGVEVAVVELRPWTW